MSVKGNFDADGWLTLGFAGHHLLSSPFGIRSIPKFINSRKPQCRKSCCTQIETSRRYIERFVAGIGYKGTG